MNDSPPQVKTKGRKILEFVLLIALFFFGFAFLMVIGEDKIVYHPSKYPAGFWQPESYGLQVEDVYFTAPDGVKLLCVVVKVMVCNGLPSIYIQSHVVTLESQRHAACLL